jgi:hypothetical protein
MTTDSLVAVTQAIKDKIVTAATNNLLSEIVDPAFVFYGDQELLPGYPAVCVEPDAKLRILSGAFRVTDNTFTVYILIYHGEVRNHQTNRKQADELGESLETLVHADATLGGLVTNIYVTEMASGYATKGKTPVRACRLTVTGMTKTRL